MSQQNYVVVAWTQVHQKPQEEEVHEQQELPGIEKASMLHVRVNYLRRSGRRCYTTALELVLVGGVHAHDSAKL